MALAAGAIVVGLLGIFVGARLLGPTPPAGDGPPHAPREPRTPAEDREPASPAAPVTDAPTAPAPPSPLTVLVPAYFYPGGEGLEDWNRLIEAASKVPVVAIVNPASGPGTSANPDYAEVLRRAKEAGVTLLGYVNTGYAKRPLPEIEADLGRWIRFYPEIGGIFLDAQASEAEHVAFYAGLHDLVKSKIDRALVVTNPGVICAEDYLARPSTDVAIMFENLQGFEAAALPSWARRYPAHRFAALPYAIATPEQMKEVLQQAILKGIGYLYVSDGTGTNPWERLPSYWAAEVEAVERINARKPL
jgi:hypothetical protein